MANLSRETLQRLHKEFMPFAKSTEDADAIRAKYPDVNEAFKKNNLKTGAQYRQEFYNERLGQHPSASGEHNPLTYVHVMLEKQRKAEAKKALIAQIAAQQKQEMLDNGSYRYDLDMGKDKSDAMGAPRRPESFDRDDLERNDRMHDKAMRAGDDTLSYTETGDIVIPKKAAQANPGLAMAAMQALSDMGANPAQYVAGSPEGSYNPDTGAQEFGWWEDLLKMGVKGADYIGNSKFGQAALTGLGTAATSKYLLGQDTKTALATGAGAGIGYGVGNYLENRANVKASELDASDKDFAEMPKATTLENYKTADGTLKNLGSAAMDAFGNFSGKGLKYAVSGAGIGQMMAPVPNNFAPLNIKDPTATKMPAMAKMSDFTDQFDQNERANLSATLPQEAPFAPIMPMVLPQGVTYQDRVRDRETGEYRYTGMSNPQDQSAFARAIKGSSRRKGLGMGFGNMILA